MVDREKILDMAKSCVCGDREQDYGSPERNFELIANFWAAYIREKCVAPVCNVLLNGEDVAAMMILFKVARVAGPGIKLDSFVDIAGYAACGGEIQSRIIPGGE